MRRAKRKEREDLWVGILIERMLGWSIPLSGSKVEGCKMGKEKKMGRGKLWSCISTMIQTLPPLIFHLNLGGKEFI